MAKNPETVFKENVLTFLKALRNTYVVKIQQVALRGTPDIFLCVNGNFVALELKRASEEKPDPLQTYELSKISQAGGLGLVANPDNFMKIMIILRDLSTGQLRIETVREDIKEVTLQ